MEKRGGKSDKFEEDLFRDSLFKTQPLSPSSVKYTSSEILHKFFRAYSAADQVVDSPF